MNATGDLVLDATLHAVPRAREFVTSALGAENPDVRDDAELVVAELVTNAVLHGQPPVTVRVLPGSESVRVEVQDCGRGMPMQLLARSDGMTGRGLALVAALSYRWGVETRDACKVVWAELSRQPSPETTLSEDLDLDELLAAWPDEEPVERVFTVTLGAVPTDLLIAAKAHIDSVVRELSLSGGAQPMDQLPPETRGLVEAVTQSFSRAREEVKRQAVAAAVREDAETNLVLQLPLSAADAGERYLAALDEADRWARAARLLTLAPPRSHQLFRRWYVQALIDQLRALAAGRQAPPVRPFPQVLADEVDRLSHTEAAWNRVQLLEHVTRQLLTATTATEAAQTVLDNAADLLAADSGRVYLITPEGTLHSIAVHGGGAYASQYMDLPLDAALPGPYVVRTGEPLLLHNMEQILERFPAMAGYVTSDRKLHVAPLVSAGRTLGVLSLTWVGNRNVEEETQVAFVTELADALGQALGRLYASPEHR